MTLRGWTLAAWIFAAAGCALAYAQGTPATAPAIQPEGPAAASAATPPATGGASAPVVDPVADQTLDALQKRDATLTDFTAKIHYDVVHSRTGDTETQLGTFDYIKGATDRKFAVQFDKSRVNQGKPRAIDEKITFDGQWLTMRAAQKMLFVKQQLAPPGKAFDPFKLGQGPFPIPIGQDKQEILHDFVVTVQPADATAGADPAPDPAADPSLPGDLVHLKLVPRDAKPYNFTQADIWVNKQAALPVQVSLAGKDGNVTTIELRDVKLNSGEANIPNLVAPAAGGAWRVEIKPYGGGGPAVPPK